MPIYMKIDGIDGAVTAKGYEKWIELESLQFGIHRNVKNPTGGGNNREAGVPAVSEVVITKSQDCATCTLIKFALFGEGKKATIDFVKTDKDKFEKYQSFELENILIANFNQSGHGGKDSDRPTESLALNFTKVTFTAIAMDEKNRTSKPSHAMWDLTQGRGS